MYLNKLTCICWWLRGAVQFKWVRCLCTFTLGREVNPADYASSGNAIFYAVLWPSCCCHSLSGCTHHALFSFCPVRRTMCFYFVLAPSSVLQCLFCTHLHACGCLKHCAVQVHCCSMTALLTLQVNLNATGWAASRPVLKGSQMKLLWYQWGFFVVGRRLGSSAIYGISGSTWPEWKV